MPISTLNRVISWQWVHLIWASCERQSNHVIRLNYFKGNIYKIKIKYVKIPRIRPCSHEIVPYWKVLALAVPSKVRKKHLCVFLWYIEFFWQQIIYDAQPKYMQLLINHWPLMNNLKKNEAAIFPKQTMLSQDFLCYTPVWKTRRIMGTPVAGGQAVSTGFPLSKSKRFYPVFIKLGEYVGGRNISTKFYYLPNPPRHSWIMALELSKNWISGICSPSWISCSQNTLVVAITIEFTTNTTGVFCVSLALLFADEFTKHNSFHRCFYTRTIPDIRIRWLKGLLPRKASCWLVTKTCLSFKSEA